MRNLTWLVLIGVLFAPGAAIAGPAEEAGAIIDRWAVAFSANDADAVVKLYAPEATLLGTVSPILSERTEAIRAYFARLPGSGFKVVFGERRVVALSDGAVLATGFYEFGRVVDGKPVLNPARFTIVVTKRGGEWLIAHHHSSQRPRPPQ
jgi:uncharacterized protein (TIGR02246 family)